MEITKEKKIESIYNKIANKEFSYGVRLTPKDKKSLYDRGNDEYVYCPTCKDDDFVKIVCLGYENDESETMYQYDYETDKEVIVGYTIKGHKVMIGNCDKLIEKGPEYFNDWITILDIWTKKEEPIDNQSEECIDYVYNLTKN